jgi:hypothetical protein
MDIQLPLHDEKPLQGPTLPWNIKVILVSDKLIFIRHGLRGWSQLTSTEEDQLIRDLGIRR